MARGDMCPTTGGRSRFRAPRHLLRGLSHKFIPLLRRRENLFFVSPLGTNAGVGDNRTLLGEYGLGWEGGWHDLLWVED